MNPYWFNWDMKRLNKGFIIISLDTELGLGHLANNELRKFDSQFEKTRDVIERLVKLFNKHDVSATWAIVGKLVEKNEIRRIEHFYPKDNIQEEDLNLRSEIYKYKELIPLLTSSPVFQDIGSHSYSHITFSSGNRNHHANKNLARDDFKAFNECFDQLFLSPKSFVFPQNRPGHENLLSKFGFHIYRGKELKWYSKLPKPFSKLAKGIDNLFPLPPSVSNPIIHESLIVETNGHLHFAKLPSGYRKFMPWWVLKIKLWFGLKKAIYFNETFHMWTHPYDLAYKSEQHFKVLEWFLKLVKKHEQKGAVELIPMNKLYEKVINEVRNTTD